MLYLLMRIFPILISESVPNWSNVYDSLWANAIWWFLLLLIGFIVGILYERCKSIRCWIENWNIYEIPKDQSIGWTLENGIQQPHTHEYLFTINFFNTKTNSIALHHIKIEFKDINNTTLFYNDQFIISNDSTLRNIDLLSNKTVSHFCDGTLYGRRTGLIPKVKSVWFIAQSTEGNKKIRRWKLAEL